VIKRLDLFKALALAFVIAGGINAASDKFLSLRGEGVLGLGAGAAGGALEGGIYTDKLFLSLQGQGGGLYYGGLLNFGLHFDNSSSFGQVVGLSGGYQDVMLKTVVNNQHTAKSIDTVKENHSSFGGVFWKWLIGKKAMFDVTHRVLLGKQKIYDYSNYPLVEESKFNLTYSLGLGVAFGNRKRAVVEEEEEPAPIIVEKEPEPIVEEIPTFAVSATVAPKDGGSVYPSGDTVVEKGSNLNFVFTPNNGFILGKVLVNSRSVETVAQENKYTYALRNISQDVSVEAQFEKVAKIEISKVASVQEGITFQTGTATLSPESRKTLEGIYMTLVDNPDTKVEIAGHTDISGSYESNIALSKRRAQAVVDYLVAKGIAANRLTAVGHGPDKPIADNATVQGREKNRRVEIRTIGKVISIHEKILFQTTTATLSPESKKVLDKIAKVLLENPDTKVEIAGHTDIGGNHEHNMSLSLKRAEAVVEYLISKGIPLGRMMAVSHGHTKPIYDKSSEEHDRVEIRTME